MPSLDLPKSRSRRALVATLVVGIAGTWTAEPQEARAAGPFDIGQLMTMLARVRAGEATFVERREVAMLERTLESSGRLSFEAPDTFIRETLRPRRERLAVVGNTLTLSQGGRNRTMELDASPEASVIIEAIRGTLTGNRAAVERNFETFVSGDAGHWTLDLAPREARLRAQVAAVQVRGEQALVREVQVRLADGDRSVMTIEPAAAVAPRPTLEAAKPAAMPSSVAP